MCNRSSRSRPGKCRRDATLRIAASAKIKARTVGMPAPSAAPVTPVGVLRIFAGRIAEVDMGRSGAVISINSHLELLNVNLPRNLFQAPCRFRLFGPGCGLNAAAYTANGACAAGSTRGSLVATLSAPPGSGTYTLGRIAMTSGLNAGFGRLVRNWDGTNWTLIAPLPFAVAAGDTFTASAGCDKATATCTLFDNLDNFGGEPFIPAPETAA